MLGELREWSEFLEPDTHNFVAMPRRRLKALEQSARRWLEKEVRRYCERNFDGMTVSNLARLYETIKRYRGLEVPLPTFEIEFAPFRPRVLQGIPKHATVVISLWGLQFWYPEAQLAKDLAQALADAGEAMTALDPHYKAQHHHHLGKKDEIADLMRRRLYAARSGLLTAFNLLECYLNSMAWDYLLHLGEPDEAILSNKKRKLLEDGGSTTLRKKVLKYPEIVAGRALPNKACEIANDFLDIVKPFRDSLVHPSPFDAPERFGGYDKLRLVYRVDVDTLFLAADKVLSFIEQCEAHINHEGDTAAAPWLQDLRHALERHETATPPEWR